MAVFQVQSQDMSFASFGARQGSEFRARNLLDGERYRMLDRRQSYYDATQHDAKRYDFEGRLVTVGTGARATQPLITSDKVPGYVPLSMRRPSSPYRLARVIVNAFTSLLFAENRFPVLRVEGDAESQDWLQAVARVGCLPIRMIRARNLGGSMGTVGLAWCFKNGKPQFTVHNAKNLQVLEWEDRDQLVPAHVVECYQYAEERWNPERRRMEPAWWWYRRDWTPDADLSYAPIPAKAGTEPEWREPDAARSAFHKDGKAHIAWIQNLPTDEVDGSPDYEGLYETFEAMDTLLSVITRGAVLNLDPTLKLKLDADQVSRLGVRKGSDNALIVGKDGDAEYLELGGSGIEAGLKLFDAKRRAALEVAQCIVPDPSEVAAQGVSSVTIKALYAPMLARAEVLREQYGQPLERMAADLLSVGKKASRSRVTVIGADGEAEEANLEIALPPRVEQVPVLDADGAPAIDADGKPRTMVRRTPRAPGEGGEVVLGWPSYFAPTPDDQAKVAATLQTATGGKAFLSKQSAVEVGSAYFGVDPSEEWRRVQKQSEADKAADAEKESALFGPPPDMGGRVSSEGERPGAGLPSEPDVNEVEGVEGDQ